MAKHNASTESVARAQQARALSWLHERGLTYPTVIDIRTDYGRLADERIPASLLGPDTVLITTDRPFHNTVLARGLRSLSVDAQCPLPGIRPKMSALPKAEELEPGSNCFAPRPTWREALMPTAPRELKKLSTRRRRIRNHFGGFHNLADLAVTASWLPSRQGALLGMRLRLSANNGMKALDASDSYLWEKLSPKEALSVTLCEALIIPVQLQLSSLKTTVFYASTAPAKVDSTYRTAFDRLREAFPKLAFQPTVKGVLIERLRAKRRDLVRGQTNEVRQGRLAEILIRMASVKDAPRSDPRGSLASPALEAEEASIRLPAL